jgi:Animal haem peroxidase
MTKWMSARRRLAVCVAVLALVASTGRPLAQRAPDGDARDAVHGEQPGRADRFGRMFHLPAFAEPTPAIRAALVALGARGGLLDARDQLSAGPIALIVDPLLNLLNPNNDTETAGMTFLGQFLDHDMTFDTGSRLGQPANPRRSVNARRPYFDLDSLYGAGPAASPLLYDPADRARLRIESGGLYEDLPREASGRAIIADPRNDENVVIAGLQAALILAHNHAVEVVRAAQPDLDANAVFEEARRQLTWHYQWIIVHEFLPQVTGPALVDRLLTNGTTYYRPQRDDAFIPVEFQIAYRMGHSMVRPSYRSNFTGSGGAPTFALVFDPTQEGAAAPADLRGGVRGSSRFVGWSTFFRFPGLEADVRPNKRLDTHLSTPLFELPLGAIAAGAPPLSLAERNLLRHLTWMVPSGQAIAARLGVPALTRAQLSELAVIHPRFVTATPLWYYVLKEAEVAEQGLRLGPVGARLVAEVFVGLLQSDSTSFLHAEDQFVPWFGATPGVSTMVDLLNFAGVGGHR